MKNLIHDELRKFAQEHPDDKFSVIWWIDDMNIDTAKLTIISLKISAKIYSKPAEKSSEKAVHNSTNTQKKRYFRRLFGIPNTS